MNVYDPAFQPDGPPVFRKDTGEKNRMRSISGWALIRMMKDQIKNRGAPITKVLAGGGGNRDGKCREMSCRWIAEQMIAEMEPGWVANPIVADEDWVEVRS